MSFLKRFQTCLESLYQLPNDGHYVIAYSGGVDSHVLLQCCAVLKLPVRAVHIHHGLQTVADDWVEHCQFVCKQLNIPLDVIYVDAKKKQRESPEESARNARYLALQNNLKTGDCLMTGQHLNDQAETLLLQLFRASGAAGLSAMPAQRKFGDNTQLRPLLSFSRQDIVAYAEQSNLSWIEDPSNVDTRFERNFIRAEMLPVLEKRWPDIMKKLASAAKLQADNFLVMQDMAAIDLANSKLDIAPSLHYFYPVVSLLSISKLRRLSSARLLNVLRYWISQSIQDEAPEQQSTKILVTRNLLEELEQSVIHTEQDAKAVIKFSGYAFRKFQDALYLLKPLLSTELLTDINAAQWQWNPEKVLTINSLGIQLECQKTSNGPTLNVSLLKEEERISIRFRQGGETFHPANRNHSQRLKKLLQEANIPPWERDLIPLIYRDEELIAVTGLWVAKDYAVSDGATGWLPKLIV